MNCIKENEVKRSHKTIARVPDKVLKPLPAVFGVMPVDADLLKRASLLKDTMRTEAMKYVYVHELLEDYGKNVYNAFVYGNISETFDFGGYLPELNENTTLFALLYIAERLPIIHAEIDACVIKSSMP